MLNFISEPVMLNSHKFWLGEILVDPTSNAISIQDHEVSVEPQVMDVLCVLAAHSRQVVLREVLIEKAWNVNYVSNESVTRIISLLRKALRELDATTEYVETVQKRGYRLLIDVEYEEECTACLLYTSPSPRDLSTSRMPSSA